MSGPVGHTVSSIAVLGAGAWGTALAMVLGSRGHDIRLWSYKPDHARLLAEQRANPPLLPGCALPESVRPTSDLDDAVADAAWVLVVVPSSAFGAVVERLAGKPPRRLAWATKGLDADSGGLLHQVVERHLSPVPRMAVVSGPSFAAEVARGLPTAVTVAANDAGFGQEIAEAFHSERFRAYTSDDVVGVELGGAVKNVLAIATGVSDGLGLGANARAALVTRGLAEITRLGRVLGADPLTFMGLAGVGDLLLTCTDDQSRNRRFGLALGRGQGVEEALRSIGSTVEGVRTAAELHALATAHSVDMPICDTVHRRLRGEIDTERAVHSLLLREPRAEVDRGRC